MCLTKYILTKILKINECHKYKRRDVKVKGKNMYTWGGIKYCTNVQMQNSEVNSSWHRTKFSQLCRLSNTKDELTVLVLNKITGRWHSVLGQEAVVAYFKVYPRIHVGDEQNHKNPGQRSWCPGRDLSQVCQKCKSKALLLSQLAELHHVVG